MFKCFPGGTYAVTGHRYAETYTVSGYDDYETYESNGNTYAGTMDYTAYGDDSFTTQGGGGKNNDMISKLDACVLKATLL